jgi:hypothetical protein
MVNCLHYLYQWSGITIDGCGFDPNGTQLFWCLGDTGQPLISFQIVQSAALADGRMRYTLSPGVCELIDSIENQLRTMPRPDYAFGYPISAAIRKPGTKRPAFLAIPYSPQFDEARKAILSAASSCNFDCEVTADLAAPGNIMDQVWQGIRGSDVVVADVTGSNANVFYEIGLAHALGKEVIILTQDASAPFDIRASRRIYYSLSDLGSLGNNLIDAFKAVSARYPFEGPEPRF